MPILAHNKKAEYHYKLLERFEAGIKLTGPEVKAARLGQINLQGSYASLRPSGPGRLKAMLLAATISPYRPASREQTDYDPQRPRELLLRAKELKTLQGQLQQPGLTLIPSKVYTKGRFIKLELALAAGKNRADKRQQIKKRELNRTIHRALKNDY